MIKKKIIVIIIQTMKPVLGGSLSGLCENPGVLNIKNIYFLDGYLFQIMF